mmetsp:Transcript_40731/g.80445  ORF Transcript_40731/g.80445 Transcript_40731/m.80445 type:complete len:104 (-) Transcript_40731:287-598(-)
MSIVLLSSYISITFIGEVGYHSHDCALTETSIAADSVAAIANANEVRVPNTMSKGVYRQQRVNCPHFFFTGLVASPWLQQWAAAFLLQHTCTTQAITGIPLNE